MFKIGIGHSEDPDTEDAVDEVITQCRTALGNNTPQAGIVLAGIDYEFDEILKKIKQAFPDIQLIGCTSGGELSSNLGYTEDTLLLAVFYSDTISMAACVARNISGDIKKSVDDALIDAKKTLSEPPKLCLVFPDIFTVGTVSLVDELKNVLGKTFPILGGGASDPWKLNKTHEFYGEEVLQDAAPMLFFAGPLEYYFNVVSGWEPFTSKRLVMECNKNVVYKIGDDSALDFYKHYLGGPPTIAHPLAVFEEGQDKFYLRAPLGIDEEKGGVVLGGDLPKQAATCICQADPPKLIEETKKLLQPIPSELMNNPACAMIISCSCRQKILGTKTKEEFNTIKDKLKEIRVFGFYAYGQICPFEMGKSSFVHNESVVILILKEQL